MRIETVENFIEILSKMKHKSKNVICFRGQSDKNWKMLPGILRSENNELLKNEDKMIRDLIVAKPSEFLADNSMFDVLVRMQHFGLPTRLLDVSFNPLVALYFAVKEGDDETEGVVFYLEIPEGRQKYYDSDSISISANICNLKILEKNFIE